MAEVHQGINKRVFGKILNDEQYNVQLKYVMDRVKQGEPVRYYTDSFNRVRVYHNGYWVFVDELKSFKEQQ